MHRLNALLISMTGLSAAIVLANGVPAPRSDPYPQQIESGGEYTAPQSIPSGELVATADWIDQIFGSRPAQRSVPQREDRSPSDSGERRKGTSIGGYRTMCVRLCDGFYFPMNFSTTRSKFSNDAERCERACPRGRLFVYRNPGQLVDDMVDLDGRPYRNLPNAFLHRTTHVADCTCQGNPWDGESVARHKAHAVAAQKLAEGSADEKVAETKPVVRPASRSERRARRPSRWAQSRVDQEASDR